MFLPIPCQQSRSLSHDSLAVSQSLSHASTLSAPSPLSIPCQQSRSLSIPQAARASHCPTQSAVAESCVVIFPALSTVYSDPARHKLTCIGERVRSRSAHANHATLSPAPFRAVRVPAKRRNSRPGRRGVAVRALPCGAGCIEEGRLD